MINGGPAAPAERWKFADPVYQTRKTIELGSRKTKTGERDTREEDASPGSRTEHSMFLLRKLKRDH